MSLSFKEQKKILKSANTLDLTPVKIYSEEINQDELVTIIIPKFKNKVILKLVSSKLKSDSFKIKLDKYGSAVWQNINGINQVGQIIKNLEKKFGQEFNEPIERTTKFIHQLYSQGFISFKELN